MSKCKRKDVLREPKKNIFQEIRKMLSSFYTSTRDLHCEFCSRLRRYMASNFGFSPKRSQNEEEEYLIWN